MPEICQKLATTLQVAGVLDGDERFRPPGRALLLQHARGALRLPAGARLPGGLGRDAAAAPEDGCAFYCYVALRAVCSAGWQLIEVQKPQIRPLSHEVTFESSYFHVSIKYSAQAVSASLIFILFFHPSLLFFSNAAEVSRSGGRRGFGSSGREELRSREETVRWAATRCKRNNFAKM